MQFTAVTSRPPASAASKLSLSYNSGLGRMLRHGGPAETEPTVRDLATGSAGGIVIAATAHSCASGVVLRLQTFLPLQEKVSQPGAASVLWNKSPTEQVRGSSVPLLAAGFIRVRCPVSRFREAMVRRTATGRVRERCAGAGGGVTICGSALLMVEGRAAIT